MLADLLVETLGYDLSARHVGATRVGRDREPCRNGDAERRHLGQPDALPPEELAPARGLLGVVVDVAHAAILAQAVHCAGWYRPDAPAPSVARGDLRQCRPCGDTSLQWVAEAFSPAIWTPRSTTSCSRSRPGPRPHVVFLATAVGDADGVVDAFHEAFSRRDCDPETVRLFGIPERPAERVAAADAVVVSGGNTANLLALWRLHGVDVALRSAWDRGAALGGVSAGANCWFEACVTDSFSVELDGLEDGLGLLPGSFCPHFDGEERRRPVYSRLVSERLPRRDRM